MLAMRARVLPLALVALGCGAGPVGEGGSVGAPPAAGRDARAHATAMITPSRLVPEIAADAVEPWQREEGRARYLVGGLRVVVHDDGRVERADERFSGGPVEVLPLPERLGGGYVFEQVDPQGTRLWHARDWTERLRPVAQLGASADELVPGFDRLYVRSKNNRLLAVDLDRGAIVPLGSLPPASSYGAMSFVDGWRAVVDTDLRGPLVTFDAGASWRPLGVSQRVLSAQAQGGQPVLYVEGGQIRIDARGRVSFLAEAPRGADATDGVDDAREDAHPLAAARRLLGDRPLRTLVEHGWPIDASTVVALVRGALVRAALPSGAVESATPDVAPSEARCHGARVGDGSGFVCGVPGGTTAIYAFSPPLGAREIYRFAEPRFVAASGNGRLVVRGRCSATPAEAPQRGAPSIGAAPTRPARARVRGARPARQVQAARADAAEPGPPSPRKPPKPAPLLPSELEARTYCILDGRGGAWEVPVHGRGGVERVTALADGRTAVLVPPRLYEKDTAERGHLFLHAGDKVEARDLRLPEEPPKAAGIARRGLWLEGFEERAPGTLGGWAEAGGPIVGVTVKLDGTVELGEPLDVGGGAAGAQALLAGRFALVVNGEAENAFESVDGGRGWRELELPSIPESSLDARSRACTPVGCALRGWVRIGWGPSEREGDLAPATQPPIVSVEPSVRQPIRLRCELDSRQPIRSTPTAAEARRTAKRPSKPSSPPPTPAVHVLRMRGGVLDAGTWAAFLGLPPPVREADDIGVDHGDAATEVPLRVYVWGPRGADWTRAGSFVARFEDRFDPGGGVRESALGRPPWPDEITAADGLGANRFVHPRPAWSATLDPGGRAALLKACRPGAGCAAFAVVDGRPVLQLRTASGALELPRPLADGVVRLGETWYLLLADAGSGAVELWRADLGVAQRVRRYAQFDRRRYGAGDAPQLVRRAQSGGLGLLVSVPADPSSGTHVGRWVVMPIHATTGELDEPIPLGPTDLGGRAPPACRADADGWLFDASLALGPVVRLYPGASFADSVELRLRVEPDSACIDALAAVTTSFRPEARAPGVPAPAGALPLLLRSRVAPERWRLACLPES
jgi:hypothetical protein